jgi:hypothetical protein
MIPKLAQSDQSKLNQNLLDNLWFVLQNTGYGTGIGAAAGGLTIGGGLLASKLFDKVFGERKNVAEMIPSRLQISEEEEEKSAEYEDTRTALWKTLANIGLGVGIPMGGYGALKLYDYIKDLETDRKIQEKIDIIKRETENPVAQKEARKKVKQLATESILDAMADMEKEAGWKDKPIRGLWRGIRNFFGGATRGAKSQEALTDIYKLRLGQKNKVTKMLSDGTKVVTETPMGTGQAWDLATEAYKKMNPWYRSRLVRYPLNTGLTAGGLWGAGAALPSIDRWYNAYKEGDKSAPKYEKGKSFTESIDNIGTFIKDKAGKLVKGITESTRSDIVKFIEKYGPYALIAATGVPLGVSLLGSYLGTSEYLEGQDEKAEQAKVPKIV